jgi:hypothetical protein
MPGGRRRESKVLRQTSGALRQTEGKLCLSERRRQRKSSPLQMLEPHDEARCGAHSKIHRCLKYLRSMGRHGAVRMPRGTRRNPMEREALTPGRQKRTAPNINCMRESWGKLAAAEFEQFFLRQELAFSRRMRGSGKNGAAMD